MNEEKRVDVNSIKDLEKRVDVNSIKDLEKRVDVLEGQPETPLVCPIFKTDLDNLNDRITVLEGGTPSEVKNPMQFTELDDFEGRVEELEGGGEETIEFKVGDILKINLKAISGYLKNTLSPELLNKEVPGCTSGDDCVTIAIQGIDGHVLDCYYHFNSAKCYVKCLTATSAKIPTINWESNQVTETLDGALYVLNDFAIENDEVTVNKDFEFYKRPHVIVNFADGNTEEFIATEDITIFTKVEPPREFDTYLADTDYLIEPYFFNTILLSNLPDSALNTIPVQPSGSGIYNPVFMFLGPDTEYSPKDSNTYELSGTNVIGFGITDEGQIKATTTLTDKQLSGFQYSVGTADDYFEKCTIRDILQSHITISDYDIFKSDTDFNLFNPVKLILFDTVSGNFDANRYIEIDLAVKGQPLTAACGSD